MRPFAPLLDGSPIVGRVCPVCRVALVVGDVPALRPMPPTTPEDRQARADGRAWNAEAEPCHWACVRPKAAPRAPHSSPPMRTFADDDDESPAERAARLSLESECRDIGRIIGGTLPEGVGFVLMMYDFGDRGSLAYIANGERDGCMKTIREWLTRQGY